MLKRVIVVAVAAPFLMIGSSISDCADAKTRFITSIAAQTATSLAEQQSSSFEEAATSDPSLAAIPPAINTDKKWRIAKTAWDADDEAGYSAFVKAIGWSNCTSLESCLASDANPYRDTDDTEFFGDCADMAYTLRAYYAWKNALPFSYQNAMRTADRSGDDLRYSKAGNVVTGRRSVAARRPLSGPAFITRMPNEVSTAMFRTHPETGGGESYDDFYPVRIDRGAVKPGILAYDIYGHVGIVYDVLEDGRILVIASHPDFSVTRTIYGPNFMRSGPSLGAGLKAWRPIELKGASKSRDGFYRGGRIVGADNAEISEYSIEQYVGTIPDPNGNWQKGEFQFQGRTVTYYDFIRRRLAAPDFEYNPVTELRQGLETICGALRDRKWAVDAARVAKVHEKPHPKRLPPNIYGTYGEWENFSTPSRDARLKVSFIELRRELQRLVAALEAGAPGVTYDGDNLARDLWTTFASEKDECGFTYWRTDNTRVRLNLGHAMDRLWDLSFDPYHCQERRWGASGAELATCEDDDVKTKWYAAQRFLRYQAERTYDVRMNFTLEELKHPGVASAKDGGLGVEAPADADIRQYILSLVERMETDNTGPLARVPDNSPTNNAQKRSHKSLSNLNILPKELVTPEVTDNRAQIMEAMYGGSDGILLTAEQAVTYVEPRFPEWHYKVQNTWARKRLKESAQKLRQGQ
ncbi:MAG: hypothetical protein AAF720_09555 [Pseudomonadota bacterium]